MMIRMFLVMMMKFGHQALSVVWESGHGEPYSGKDRFQEIYLSKIVIRKYFYQRWISVQKNWKRMTKGSKTDPQIGKPVRAVLNANMEAWRDAVIIRVARSLR